jgi:signal transduction histidine kinase
MVNAYKYSPEGGTITFLVEKNEKELIFKIEDEGIGIPDEDKLHLFEPFHRSRNCDDIPGTGLGLSIVKKSVEIQSGTISFESELMRGTRFIITIPLN